MARRVGGEHPGALTRKSANSGTKSAARKDHAGGMADTERPPDVDLDDVVARARELPTRLRSLRVETRGWTDIDRSSLASERSRVLLAYRRPVRVPTRRFGVPTPACVRGWSSVRMHGPRRSSRCGRRARRQEREQTSFDGDRSRFVSARDGDTYWFDQGDGVKVTDGSKMMMSLSSSWVVSRRWTSDAMQRELLDVSSSVLGRSGVRIRVTPRPESKWRLRHVFIGDAHEITVDLATGMTLAVTS